MSAAQLRFASTVTVPVGKSAGKIVLFNFAAELSENLVWRLLDRILARGKLTRSVRALECGDLSPLWFWGAVVYCRSPT